jgi:hypothetical protein
MVAPSPDWFIGWPVIAHAAFELVPVPEPTTGALVALGLAALVARARVTDRVRR